MEVDNADLMGHGWRPFTDREDHIVIGKMLFDAAAGIPSRYDVCATKRNGERLYVEVRTMAVHDLSGETWTAGRVDLRAWESPRRHVFLAKALSALMVCAAI